MLNVVFLFVVLSANIPSGGDTEQSQAEHVVNLLRTQERTHARLQNTHWLEVQSYAGKRKPVSKEADDLASRVESWLIANIGQRDNHWNMVVIQDSSGVSAIHVTLLLVEAESGKAFGTRAVLVPYFDEQGRREKLSALEDFAREIGTEIRKIVLGTDYLPDGWSEIP